MVVLNFKFVENCLLCLRGSCWTSEDFHIVTVLKLHVTITTYCALQQQLQLFWTPRVYALILTGNSRQVEVGIKLCHWYRG